MTATAPSHGISVMIQTDSQCEDDRMRKHRRLKRKILEFIPKFKTAQRTLDRANRKIQKLEKDNLRLLMQSRGGETMDISQAEEDDEDEDGEDEDEDEDEEEDQLAEEEDTVTQWPVVAITTSRRQVAPRKPVEIPRDENGNVQLPFQIAALTIVSLGNVVSDRDAFHSDRYIWPVGYTAERQYISMTDPESQTTYTCTVEDVDDKPLFTIRAADAPDEKLSALTATGVWSQVLKKANEVRQKKASNAVSGPEQFGFAHPLVREMIEELDGADSCKKYQRLHK